MFNINPKKQSGPIIIIQLLFYLMAAIIIFKLIELQIIDFDHLKARAKQMRQNHSMTFVMRGEIEDRNGVTLASDSTVYDIYVDPRNYAQGNKPEQVAFILAPIVHKDYGELVKLFRKNRKYSFLIAKNVEKKIAHQLANIKEIKCLDIRKKAGRVYPQKELASHILGYVNPDANVYAGVENTASKSLSNMPHYRPVEVTPKGDIIYDNDADLDLASKPLKGEKLTLTIDSAIQHIAEVELGKMLKQTDADRGTVIVMNPKNGEILGFAVLPSYDPSDYKKVNPSIIKNWVLSDVYPPGSTFKVLTIASALETGKITKDTKVLDTGKTKVQGWTIKNYDYKKKKYPGVIDLVYLFEHSSNVGSLSVALKMEPQEFYDMLRLFGIGEKTGIDLPGESAGILPEAYKWHKSTHATIGFGYSIATTPIQIASAVGAIANDGLWVTPHVIKYDKHQQEEKIRKIRVLSSENSKIVTDLLHRSIEESKSTAGKIPHFTVAGKTGTSRKPNPNGKGYLRDNVFTSFVGYFPSKDPEVLIMVVVDNPKGVEMWGSTVAGPVFNEIATQVTRILNLKPDALGLHVKKDK